MAFDGFLFVDKIKGECKDEGKSKLGGHKDWIDITSFMYSVNSSQSVDTGGGLSAGKSTLGDFTFTQKYHKGSPALWVYCATGEHIKEVKFEARKSQGNEQFVYLTLISRNGTARRARPTAGPDNKTPTRRSPLPSPR